MLLCYKISDQEAYQVHQVKAHNVRAFAASKAFQGGVSFDQSENNSTQFCLLDIALADFELYHLGPIMVAQQILHSLLTTRTFLPVIIFD